MKTSLLFCAGLAASTALVSGAYSQAPVVTPTTPAPAVAMPSAPTDPLPAPDRVIYGQRLPTPEELRSVAAAQGLTLDRIEQTNAQIIAVYHNANGQTSVTSYQVLGASGVAPGQPAGTATVVPAPAPRTTVIYESRPDPIYYDPYYYWPWYSPIRVGVGLGFTYRGGGYYHGGYHGGGWGRGGGHFGHR